jgi:hypothetical protein
MLKKMWTGLRELNIDYIFFPRFFRENKQRSI